MFTRCTDPAREDEFNRWYTHVHLPDLSRAPGFVGARRWMDPDAAPGAARYMTVYEFDGMERADVLRETTRLALEAFERGRHIDCIDMAAPGPTAMGYQWVEIEPASVPQPDAVDYPPAPPEVREGMRALVASLEES